MFSFQSSLIATQWKILVLRWCFALDQQSPLAQMEGTPLLKVVLRMVPLMLLHSKLAPFGTTMNSVSSWLFLSETREKCKPWRPFYTHLQQLEDGNSIFAKSVFGLL